MSEFICPSKTLFYVTISYADVRIYNTSEFGRQQVESYK